MALSHKLIGRFGDTPAGAELELLARRTVWRSTRRRSMSVRSAGRIGRKTKKAAPGLPAEVSKRSSNSFHKVRMAANSAPPTRQQHAKTPRGCCLAGSVE